MTTLTHNLRAMIEAGIDSSELDSFVTHCADRGIDEIDLARLLSQLADSGTITGSAYVACYGLHGDRRLLTVREESDTDRYCSDGDNSDDDYPIWNSARRVVWCEYGEFWFDTVNAIQVRGLGRQISQHEYESGEFFTCDQCNEVFHNDDYESDGCCVNCDAAPTRLVHDYRANVLDVIGRQCIGDDGSALTIANRLVFGVELETSTRNASREEIAEALHSTGERFAELAICKEDGTVSGPEIVTLPATLTAHASFIPWKQWCEVLSKNNRARSITGDAEVGFHVHVNRAALSPLTIGKLMMFINNDALTISIWEKLAQRSQNRWCAYQAKKWRNGIYRDGDRYQALNDTGHGKTLEFRIFRASLRPDRILKNIEAVHAAIRYCQNESARELSGARFLSYVKAQRATYPNLARFIGEKRIAA